MPENFEQERRKSKVLIRRLCKKVAISSLQFWRNTITIDDAFITVDDSGIGIRESMTPHLFERFERGGIDDINAIEGSGLGLSIVQRIMVHLGWQLHYHPNAAGGSTFKIQYKNALSKIDSNDYNNE